MRTWYFREGKRSRIMNEENRNIEKKAFSGVVWKFAERILAQLVSLVISIVLARMLTPQDYSVVGVVVIFFNFANILISGGLNTALMQKKNADTEDYSTVLHVSLLLSVALYGVLFFVAPAISVLYDQPILVPVVRVMAFSLPIYAVKSILCAYVSANLQFRKFFFSTIGGTLASAVVGICMAYNGFGAWALVAQQMTNALIDTLILFLTTRFRIVLRISFTRLKGLFNYGWKVLVTSLLNTTYAECIPAFIGIRFTTTDLSFYTKGKSFPELLSSTVTNTLSAVLFPVMAKFQDDKERLLQYTRKFMQVSSYVAFPLMLGFLAVSDTFISVVLTDKWLSASFYIRVFCISSMFDMIHLGNSTTIKAMGRSDISLVMEIIKKTSYFIVIAAFMFLGQTPQALAISSIICTAIAIIVNTIPNVKLIGYSYKSQAKDLIPNLLMSILMCVAVSFVGMLKWNLFMVMLLQIFVGIVVYVLLSLITKNSSFFFLLNILKSYLPTRKSR